VPGCPLTAALNAIGGKWNLICLYGLDSGTRRFSELRRLMPEVSPKVLSATLRNLEREGLVSRTVYAEVPARVEYPVSPHGEPVREVMRAVRVWGRERLEWKRSGDGTTPSPALPSSSKGARQKVQKVRSQPRSYVLGCWSSAIGHLPRVGVCAQ